MGNWQHVINMADIAEAAPEGAAPGSPEFIEYRDRFVARIQEAPVWAIAKGDDTGDYDEFVDAVENEIASAGDLEEMDFGIQRVYDWGDIDHLLFLNLVFEGSTTADR